MLRQVMNDLAGRCTKLRKVLLAYHYGTMEAPEKGGGYERALESDPDASRPFLKDLDAPFLTLNPGETLRLPLL